MKGVRGLFLGVVALSILFVSFIPLSPFRPFPSSPFPLFPISHLPICPFPLSPILWCLGGGFPPSSFAFIRGPIRPFAFYSFPLALTPLFNEGRLQIDPQ